MSDELLTMVEREVLLQPIVSVSDLAKTYASGLQALKDINLEIRCGEIFALLGPNGAGKTTTIEVLEGYRKRDGGDVRVLGVDPARGGRRWKAQLGIVLQSGAGDSQLSVRELLTARASYYGEPRDPGEVLELVGLTDKAGARGRTLSGGQRRRLDVALGIVGRPRRPASSVRPTSSSTSSGSRGSA